MKEILKGIGSFIVWAAVMLFFFYASAWIVGWWLSIVVGVMFY